MTRCAHDFASGINDACCAGMTCTARSAVMDAAGEVIEAAQRRSHARLAGVIAT
jgi:hypothetical protein